MTEFKPIPRRAAIDADYSKDINQLYENTLHLKNKVDQIENDAIPDGSVTTAKINNSDPISFGNNTQAIDKDTGAVIVANGGLAVESNIALGGQIISEIADGTAPMIVGSTTMVDNLNADMIDAAHKSIDGTFAANSDLLIPTEKAVKTYVNDYAIINDYAMRYDYVIDSQAKFDAMVASGTWLNAKNVLFTTDVTRAAQTTIPATVEKIHAINGATLTVTGLTTGQYGFGYATKPTDPKFEIRNFAVNVTGTGSINGFRYCNNLTNCTGAGTGTSFGYGFSSCNKLTNCTGTGTGSGTGTGIGFNTCTQLTDCSGTGSSTGTGNGHGFYTCNKLTNCTGTGTGTGYGTGFNSCTQLNNCTGTGTGTGDGYGFNSCTQLTNCTGNGTGTGTGSGIGFNSCNQLNNCTGDGTGTNIGTGNGYGHGFLSCTQLTNCTGTGTSAGPGVGYGFNSCNQLTDCSGTGIGTDAAGHGFYSCNNLTNCTGIGTGAGTGTGFNSCTQVTNCTGTGNNSGSGSGYGYRGCRKCMCNKAGGVSTTATYNTSYADAGTSNACADTAAGGYNS